MSRDSALTFARFCLPQVEVQLQNIVSVADCLDLLLEEGIVVEVKSSLMGFFTEVYLKTERDFNLSAYGDRILELLDSIATDIDKFLRLNEEVSCGQMISIALRLASSSGFPFLICGLYRCT